MKISWIWIPAVGLLLATGCDRQQAREPDRRGAAVNHEGEEWQRQEPREHHGEEETPNSPERQQQVTQPEREHEERAMEPEDQTAELAMQACPVALPGVDVQVENIRGGTAYLFTTEDEQLVDEVRTRVEKMSQVYAGEEIEEMEREEPMREEPMREERPEMEPGLEPQPGEPRGTEPGTRGLEGEDLGEQPGTRGQPGEPRGRERPEVERPEAQIGLMPENIETSVEETEQGARLELRAEETRDIARLRTLARTDAEMMRAERRCLGVEQQLEQHQEEGTTGTGTR